MILAIRQFFDRNLAAAGDSDSEERLRLAAAALMIEVAQADYTTRESERDEIVAAVRSKFGLTDDESAELVALAQEEVRNATGLFEFTSLINEHWSREQKIELIERMWRVAYADARIDKHEQHLMRKMVRLLYIPQSDYIAAKLRARDTTGSGRQNQ